MAKNTQVAQQVNGVSGGTLRVTGENAIPVWIRLQEKQRNSLDNILALTIKAGDGSEVPLISLASPHFIDAATAETHQGLIPNIDVLMA